jgi:hypothetical protein
MFFKYLDNNPAIIQWASEPITIPYRNPFTGKNTFGSDRFKSQSHATNTGE